MRSAPNLPTTDELTVRPWTDQVIDALGHDPRSVYVETFWLGVLGPSTTLFLRHLATQFDAHPDGFTLDLPETAARLGLGGNGGRHSPFTRAIARSVQFDMAQLSGATTLEVRRHIPPVNRRHLIRMPETLQQAHTRWQEAQRRIPPVEQMRRRARRLALSALQLGLDRDEVERQLMQWRFHPAICFESAEWAWEQHEAAVREESRVAALPLRRPPTATARALPAPPPDAA
ncbi:MAG: hypothetical protein ACR2H3_13930 [Acidimicrobiales bacterium]